MKTFSEETPNLTQADFELDDFKFRLVNVAGKLYASLTHETGPVANHETPQMAVASLFADLADEDAIEVKSVQRGSIEYTAEVLGVRITVVEKSMEWLAYLNDNPEDFETGKIPKEAIGNLIWTRCEEVNQ